MSKVPIFVSFKYKEDNWRVQQVLNCGVVEGDKLLSPNEWEEVKRKGDPSIKAWIDGKMKYKRCTVVLIGEKTSESKWVKYEIERSFELGKPVIGIHINKLKDRDGNQSSKGSLPYTSYNSRIKIYDSIYESSDYSYNYIKQNITTWIDNAIR